MNRICLVLKRDLYFYIKINFFCCSLLNEKSKMTIGPCWPKIVFPHNSDSYLFFFYLNLPLLDHKLKPLAHEVICYFFQQKLANYFMIKWFEFVIQERQIQKHTAMPVIFLLLSATFLLQHDLKNSLRLARLVFNCVSHKKC